MIYDRQRDIWYQEIGRANKDYPPEGIEKGQPYVRVKKNTFSQPEKFKTMEEVHEKYPIITVAQRYKKELKLLRGYKRELDNNPNLSPLKYLESIKQ